jgi:hypothetical protein
MLVERWGMGYRSSNRQNRSHRRGYSTSRPPEPGLIDDALDGIVALVARLFRWVFRMRLPDALAPRYNQTRGNRFARIDATVKRWDEARAFNAQPLPYRRTECLLLEGERALWYPLFHAVKGRYRIFAKVRLADVVCCPEDHPDEWRWFRKIGRYHVDFVICEPKTTAPLLVVELDGRRHHSSQRRRDKDEFKNAVLEAAGVPIYRIAAQQAYDPKEIAENIDRMIRTSVVDGAKTSGGASKAQQ